MGKERTRKEYRIFKLVRIAKSLVGCPYKYGAKVGRGTRPPRFFDCSLLTQYVFKQVGVKLPRTAIEQAMVGKKVSLNKIKEGDVIFMKGEIGRYNKYFPGGIGHAGIYVGNNKVIHATRKRISGRYADIYNPKLIKEIGKVVVENLDKFIKGNKPLIAIKRHV